MSGPQSNEASIASKESGSTEVPSHRACQHCRSQKVRCIIDDDSQDTCQRCARAGRICVFTPLQKRKQRKRTDTRVAELEKEMRQMRAALQKKERSNPSQRINATAPDSHRSDAWSENTVLQTSGVQGLSSSAVAQVAYGSNGQSFRGGEGRQRDIPQLWPSRFANRPPDDTKDLVDSGVISMATARQLFETYRTDLYPTYPLVAIPSSTSADEVRQTKPALFLAIIAAAAGKDNSDLSAILDKAVLHAYATRHVVNSEKSMELVQALLISAVWYHPPTRFGQLKYYEYLNMAATMALDIGIGSRAVPHRNLFCTKPQRGRTPTNIHPLEDATNPDLSMTPRSRDQSPDTGNLESRRTFLACFIACTGVTMSLRRPNILRVSSYVRECLEYLERAPNAEPSDRTLVAWAKLMIVAEEMYVAFSYDDPGSIASITELKTQLMLKEFERRLTTWFENTPEADMIESLAVMYYSIRIYLHEVALHVDHSPEDFKAPYQMGPVHKWEGDDVPTQVLAEAVADCINSSHNLMRTFINTDPEKARGFPVQVFVRISYASFILAKLCLSVANPCSRIGKVLQRSQLKVEIFLDRAILHARAIVGSVRCRVPAIFLALLFKLRQWCLDPHLLERSKAALAGPAIDVTKPTDEGALLDAPTKAKSESNGAGSIEIPSGGDENSPQTCTGAQREQYESFAAYAAKTANDLDPDRSNITPESHTSDYDDHEAVGYAMTTVPAISTPHTEGFNGGPRVQEVNRGDQMEMDQEFLQFFDDMNNMSQGGLTGLDDWSMWTEIPTLPEGFDWQAVAGTYSAATL